MASANQCAKYLNNILTLKHIIVSIMSVSYYFINYMLLNTVTPGGSIFVISVAQTGIYGHNLNRKRRLQLKELLQYEKL